MVTYRYQRATTVRNNKDNIELLLVFSPFWAPSSGLVLIVSDFTIVNPCTDAREKANKKKSPFPAIASFRCTLRPVQRWPSSRGTPEKRWQTPGTTSVAINTLGRVESALEVVKETSGDGQVPVSLRPSAAVRVMVLLGLLSRGSAGPSTASANATTVRYTAADAAAAAARVTVLVLVMMVMVVMVLLRRLPVLVLLRLLPVVPALAAVVLVRYHAVHDGSAAAVSWIIRSSLVVRKRAATRWHTRLSRNGRLRTSGSAGRLLNGYWANGSARRTGWKKRSIGLNPVKKYYPVLDVNSKTRNVNNNERSVHGYNEITDGTIVFLRVFVFVVMTSYSFFGLEKNKIKIMIFFLFC